VQTVSDVYLKYTCSLNTSAFSTLVVLADNCTTLIYFLAYISGATSSSTSVLVAVMCFV